MENKVFAELPQTELELRMEREIQEKMEREMKERMNRKVRTNLETRMEKMKIKDEPMAVNMETSSDHKGVKTCICMRPSQGYECGGCRHFFRGRIAETCEKHPSVSLVTALLSHNDLQKILLHIFIFF